ncbi:MAG: NADH-quinone oxidoreductase subunit L, partial [Candidatus Competibacteraceae bacterium]|nr:NADH-quinone oxidoreductase subunit L [Candidatus Competibacteraceae bacterium]
MQNVYHGVVLASPSGAFVAGLLGRKIGRAGAHWVTIIGVAVSFLLSLVVLRHHVLNGAETYNESLYTWMVVEG